jgi:catechol 2,3-dioxygenase-like lactoylglutathione lyase family enzyme
MVFRRVVMAAPSTAAQRDFYNGLLELPLTASSDREVAVQAGETELVFTTAAPGTSPSYHFAFRIPGNRFGQAKSWLQERAELIRHGGMDEFPWDFWNASAVYVLDPAGNIVELIGFRDLDETDMPFDVDSLLGLAEVGTPVHDVAETVTRLARTFAVGLWDRRQPSPERITPVGRRGASLIVVSLGRRWFLGPGSADHPLEIVLDDVAEGELEPFTESLHIRSA